MHKKNKLNKLSNKLRGTDCSHFFPVAVFWGKVRLERLQVTSWSTVNLLCNTTLEGHR